MAISEAALARKKKFREQKEQAGDVKKLMTLEAAKPWRVWFDQHGEIIAFTNESVTNPELKTYDFPHKIIQMLRDPDTNIRRYHVQPDSKDPNKYHVVVRVFDGATDFDSTLIKLSDLTSPELLVKLTAKSLIMTLSDDAVCKTGASTLTFHVTYRNDPHVLHECIDVDLAKLRKNKKLTKRLKKPINTQQHSIYVLPVFNTIGLEEK